MSLTVGVSIDKLLKKLVSVYLQFILRFYYRYYVNKETGEGLEKNRKLRLLARIKRGFFLGFAISVYYGYYVQIFPFKEIQLEDFQVLCIYYL